MKALLFDMDGTMVDNMMIHHRAWQRQLRKLGLDWPIETVMEQVHGVNEEILLRLFGDQLSADQRRLAAAEKEAAYREIYAPEIQAIDGLMDLLQSAKQLGIPMGVATAAPGENAEFVLDALALRPYFASVVHADQVSRGKPDPEVLFKAAEGLGFLPSDCLLFEDSPTGAAAAQNADCPVVVLTTTHQREEFSAYANVIGFIEDFQALELVPTLDGWDLNGLIL